MWDEFYDQRTHTRRKTRNADATEAAEQKPAAIQGRFSLWQWQRDLVDRPVATPAVFCAHEIGLVKTLTAVTLAMTLPQFGLANWSALIVPLLLIEQVTRQRCQAWPAGRNQTSEPALSDRMIKGVLRRSVDGRRRGGSGFAGR